MFVHKMNEEIYQRACKVIAGGALSNFKKAKNSAPVYVKKAEGCHIYDYDDNLYYDFSLSAGPAILGHSNRAYQEALKEQIDKIYTNWDGMIQIEAAEKLQQIIPSAELVRFAVSGADAVFNAVRVARGYTGKNLYVKFKGQYHGGLDYILGGRTEKNEARTIDGIDSTDYYSDMCYTEGRARHALDDCLMIEWNDLAEMEALFQEEGNDIACVVMEPVPLNMSGCLPEPGYLEGVRELCIKYNVVLIFDETLTGFRMALGGAQEYFGVVPDLCVFAKAVGGGFPVAVYAGKREVMRVIADARVLAVGTYNGHPIAAAAILETIRQMEENDGESFRMIASHTEMAKCGMENAAKSLGIQMIVQGMPGALFPVFTKKEKIINHRDAIANADFSMHRRFMNLLKDRGILHNSRLVFSPMHTQQDIDYLIRMTKEALTVMASDKA